MKMHLGVFGFRFRMVVGLAVLAAGASVTGCNLTALENALASSDSGTGVINGLAGGTGPQGCRRQGGGQGPQQGSQQGGGGMQGPQQGQQGPQQGGPCQGQSQGPQSGGGGGMQGPQQGGSGFGQMPPDPLLDCHDDAKAFCAAWVPTPEEFQEMSDQERRLRGKEIIDCLKADEDKVSEECREELDHLPPPPPQPESGVGAGSGTGSGTGAGGGQ